MPVVHELSAELARRTNEPALARKGTAVMLDGLLALLEASAETVHVAGAKREDVPLMPLSSKAMALCIFGRALGLDYADLTRVIGTAWDKAAEMNIIPPRGN